MNLEWKKIKEEKFKAGWRKMIHKVFILPNGKTQDYDIKDEGTNCCILALTPDNKVILEKVFRPGTEKILLEMPGGYIDENEKPEDSALRELLEETGMEGSLQFAGIVTDDAYSNCIRYVYVIKNCKKMKEPKLEEDEIYEIIEMDLKDFRKHLKSGNLTDSEAGYIALDHLGLL